MRIFVEFVVLKFITMFCVVGVEEVEEILKDIFLIVVLKITITMR